MAKNTNPDKYAKGLFLRTEQYAEIVRNDYVFAVDELLELYASVKLSPGEKFSFSNYPKKAIEADQILRGLYSRVYNSIKEGVIAEWDYANISCDALITSIFGKGVVQSNHMAKWFSRNQEALDAFFARKSKRGGLNLSQKIWKYTGQLKYEMETALSVSLGEGLPAAKVSRQVREYLEEPDRLFRRVRDSNGNLKPSKAMKKNAPGKGEYNSSFKNAMRVARTEPNIAYRTADYERWMNLDFVIGVEIKTSRNHKVIDICDDLEGIYPKGFKFTGWHPQCTCFATPVLADMNEMIEVQKMILQGNDVSNYNFTGEVNKTPAKFNAWVRKNQNRIDQWKDRGTQPYFIQDNMKYVA